MRRKINAKERKGSQLLSEETWNYPCRWIHTRDCPQHAIDCMS